MNVTAIFLVLLVGGVCFAITYYGFNPVTAVQNVLRNPLNITQIFSGALDWIRNNLLTFIAALGSIIATVGGVVWKAVGAIKSWRQHAEETKQQASQVIGQVTEQKTQLETQLADTKETLATKQTEYTDNVQKLSTEFAGTFEELRMKEDQLRAVTEERDLWVQKAHALEKELKKKPTVK